jgi:hypothetical protein
MTMRIRGSLDAMNGQAETTDFPDGICIVDDNGLAAFSIRMKGNGIEISAGLGVCKLNNELLDSSVSVKPQSSNNVIVERIPYL